MQGVHRLLQELHLHFVLVLNVTIFNDDFLVVILDVALKFVQHTHLQLFVIVNVLGNPVDSIFEGANVTLVLPDLGVGSPDRRLHVLLLESEIFDQESQVSIKRVELLEFFVLRVGFQLELPCLDLLWRDFLLKLFNAVIKHELELLELLSLLLELVDFCFTVADLLVFRCDLVVKELDVVLMVLQNLLLLLNGSGLVDDVALKAFHVSRDILHLALD